MNIDQYPVTEGYGKQPDYPLNNGFHNGIDYGLPMGTPVIVNGVTIGLSNNTGASTGPHLHVGKFINGVVQDPGVDNGFQFNSAVVYDTGSDSTNGNFVRITADGALWVYLHLESILVTKGQVLEENTVSSIGDVEARILIKHIYGYTNEKDIEGAIPALLSGESNTIIRMMDGTPTAAAYQAQIKEWANDTPATVKPYSGPPLFEKK